MLSKLSEPSRNDGKLQYRACTEVEKEEWSQVNFSFARMFLFIRLCRLARLGIQFLGPGLERG